MSAEIVTKTPLFWWIDGDPGRVRFDSLFSKLSGVMLSFPGPLFSTVPYRGKKPVNPPGETG